MKIIPSKLGGDITIPPSKSLAHRSIIAAGLSSGTSNITNLDFSEDIIATINAMEKLGANIEVGKSSVLVTGISQNGEDHITIDCNESGSTLRFMIPIVAMSSRSATFTGSGLLPKRPQQPYFDIFQKENVKYETGEDNLPLKVTGTLSADYYELPGDVSSQFITGLLFALPLLKKDATIRIISPLQSKGYVNLTLDILSDFGINADFHGDIIKIMGNSSYKSTDYRVEGDWSQAAFFILSGLICGDVRIYGLNPNSKQGDIAIMNIAKRMGGNLSFIKGVLHIGKSKLSACDVDVSQCPDLAPVIAAMMTIAIGESKIYGGERLRIKESDRIDSVSEALGRLGAQVLPTLDGMIINGNIKLGGGEVKSHNDHRIAMLMGAISPICSGEIVLDDGDCVKKSYPKFWQDIKSIGGNIYE